MTNINITATTNATLDLPDDADALALLLDIIDTATTNIAHAMRYARDRFDMISDYDDYIPADTRILNATADRFFAHIDDTPRDALIALLTDPDFIDDLYITDSTYLIHDYLTYDD